jgi:hypothetical protein
MPTEAALMGAFDSPLVDLATSPTVDAFGIVGKGIGAAREMRDGHPAEGARKGAETLGAEFELAHRLYGDPATAQVASNFASITSFADATEHLSKTKDRAGQKHDPNDKRSSVDRKLDETVLGTADVVKTVGNIANTFGGAEVKSVTDTGAMAMKLGNKGVQMSGEWGLHGKDKDGHNRRVDDDVADKGTAMHDLVHRKLGDGTMSDILSHGAGGAAMLNELPGAGAEAAALGAAGYAVDTYHKAAETAGTVKRFVTNPKVQEYAAKLYMGLF